MKRTTTLLLFLLFTIGSFAVTVSVAHMNATCGICNGTAEASASGGLPPYSFIWSPAPPSGQGTPNVAGLCAGDWTVEVTDGLGNTDTETFTVLDLPGLASWIPTQVLMAPCIGGCNAWVAAWEANFGGAAPYTYDYGMLDESLMGPGSVTFQGLCPGTTTVNVTDANGCTGYIEIYLEEMPMGVTSGYAVPACDGMVNGTIVVFGPGDQMDYELLGPNGLDSLIHFGDFGPHVIEGLEPGPYTVMPVAYPPWGGGEYTTVWCTAPLDVVVDAIAGPCGQVSGNVFHDADQDCILNGSDFVLPYRVLGIEPGDLFAITNGSGHYVRALAYGDYTIDQGAVADMDPVCPATGSVDFTLDGLTPEAVVDFANLSTLPHDLSVSIASTTARPGFPTQVWVHVTNNSAFISGDVTLDLTYDPLLLNPNITGPVALGVIAPYSSAAVHFTADLPPNIDLLGTVMTYFATATNTVSEPNTANNTASVDVTITGSYDPNDKQGRSSSGLSATHYFLDQDEWIDYTIRFQNTGTAAAEIVVIRDTIDADLDVFSLQILGSSHDFTPSFGDGRELVFTFDNIDLPDSTTDLLGSQGFIRYRIRPNDDVVVGTLLQNTAGIFFDFNPPIITNTVPHVVDFSTSLGRGPTGSPRQLTVLPNPATEVLNVMLPESANSDLQVLSTDGRTIELPTMRRMNGIQLDVRSLARGTYIIRSAESSALFMKQ